jgi:hypothetical protein
MNYYHLEKQKVFRLKVTKATVKAKDNIRFTFGSPCDARIVLRRSNGYDPTVAAHPARAPLT